MVKTKYIIAGAGLAGLTTAYQLLMQGETDFIVLEGRDRIGGRIHTEKGVDLGGTWFQSYHNHLAQLIEALGLSPFPQYQQGKSVFIYSSMAPAQYFENDNSQPSASRITGGSMALIEALAQPLADKIKRSTKITKIAEQENTVVIHTDQGLFTAEKIILAFPPRLSLDLAFEPALPASLVYAITNTHTWMSNAIKVGITYDRPFWRDKKLSGTIIGHVGPTIELYDHSDQAGSTFSLMGFVNEALRDESPESRKEKILTHIEKHLGKEARNYTAYHEKDWSTDPFTSCTKLKSIYLSPSYGNPLFQDFYMQEKLLFASAETSPVYGGYMEGAVYSGLLAARKLMSF